MWGRLVLDTSYPLAVGSADDGTEVVAKAHRALACSFLSKVARAVWHCAVGSAGAGAEVVRTLMGRRDLGQKILSSAPSFSLLLHTAAPPLWHCTVGSQLGHSVIGRRLMLSRLTRVRRR